MSAVSARTVLVVEDDPHVRALLERLVRGAGYAVVAAGSGAEALAALDEADGAVDLLLTDVGLGDLHGGELARRAVELHPGLPVIYASGQGRARALAAGMPPGDAFLVKPFRAEDLREVLDEVFARRG